MPGPIEVPESQRATLAHLGVVLTQRHDLRGLFGVDLIVDHKGRLWPTEINPRYTDSLALLEQAGGRSLLNTPRPVASAGATHGRAVVRDTHGQILGTVTARQATPQACRQALMAAAMA